MIKRFLQSHPVHKKIVPKLDLFFLINPTVFFSIWILPVSGMICANINISENSLWNTQFSYKILLLFFGIIDFLSIIPTYISIFLPASRYLSVIRILRVLRIFRILKLIFYIGEANLLVKAMYASRRKVIVFLFSILTFMHPS